MSDFKNVPDDVKEVWFIQTYIKRIGCELYTKCQATIVKYPEYFPWETTYKSIPQEVHEAYLDELYPKRHEPLNCSGKGLFAQIQDLNLTEVTVGNIFEKWDDYYNNQKEKQILIEKRKEDIWNKYYGKYKLKYRK